MYAYLVVEALILRTWPVHEADQIVSFFTREQGKLRGIAKSAAKSRKRFGGALEPMTYVLASYVEKPRQELVRLDACEIVASPLSEPVDYGRAVALEFFSEVLEETLQDRDPQDAVFRLTVSVLEQTQSGRIWLPVTYFGVWMVRLMGWMPEIVRCTVCGRPFAGEPAYFESQQDGLVCMEHRHPAARALSAESLRTAARMFREPIAALAAEEWPRNRAADLRRFALQGLERHLEKRLRSAQALNQLGESRATDSPARPAEAR
ncbi:MAG TPA: DNA repair protein RecO [Acidobacteriaceae bacterium]|nr:DNA repair protein RecO [Acidobacteriaceae bacterium]